MPASPSVQIQVPIPNSSTGTGTQTQTFAFDSPTMKDLDLLELILLPKLLLKSF